MTGAPPAFASQRFWIRLIVPFVQSRFSALLTHRRSELPCSKTIPKRSRPPRFGNCPTMTPSSTCTAVTKNAVGRSTTIPSIWPFLRACTARSFVSYASGLDDGLMWFTMYW